MMDRKASENDRDEVFCANEDQDADSQHCKCQHRNSERASGLVDDVMRGVGCAIEEEVVLEAHVGDDGHLYLDEAALVSGWDQGRKPGVRGRGRFRRCRWR